MSRARAASIVLGLAVSAAACASAEHAWHAEPGEPTRPAPATDPSAASTEHVAAQGALGPYSAAVLAGEWCFLAGKVAPQEARGGRFRDEAAAALDALAAELARAGLSLADAVSVTVYLTDMSLYPELNEVYAARVPAPYPARATVAVSALPAGARVELSVIARRH